MHCVFRPVEIGFSIIMCSYSNSTKHTCVCVVCVHVFCAMHVDVMLCVFLFDVILQYIFRPIRLDDYFSHFYSFKWAIVIPLFVIVVIVVVVAVLYF